MGDRHDDVARTGPSATLVRPLLFAAAAGVLLAATLPPWGWWPLGPVGAGTLWLAVKDRPVLWRAACGAVAGAGLYAIGLFWVTEFTLPGFVAVVLLESVILAVALAAVPPGRAQGIGLVAALVAAEAFRGAWPFGGLPLGGIDIGQAGGPLAPAARLGGHLLLVALVVAAGIGLAGLYGAARWRRPVKTTLLPSAVLAGIVAMCLLGEVAPDGSPVGTMTASAVQGGGSRGLRAVDSDAATVLRAHVDASGAVKPPAALVVWPEDVVDVDGRLSGSAEESAVAEVARRLGVTLVAGVVEDVADDRFRNAAVVWAPDGRRVARYDKVHRVPFGEYVPARRLFDRMADLSDVPRDAIAGTGPGVVNTSQGRLGVLVSFEVFFAERGRAAVSAGGTVLLVPTNASSYRRSQVPGQEVAVARLRAVETGRWVVQAAPTGYSAVIDHRGRVVARSGLGERRVVTSVVERRAGRTIATRMGDSPLVVISLLFLIAGWAVAVLQRRREPAPA